MTANVAVVWACVVSAIVLMGVPVVGTGVDGGVAVWVPAVAAMAVVGEKPVAKRIPDRGNAVQIHVNI